MHAPFSYLAYFIQLPTEDEYWFIREIVGKFLDDCVSLDVLALGDLTKNEISWLHEAVATRIRSLLVVKTIFCSVLLR